MARSEPKRTDVRLLRLPAVEMMIKTLFSISWCPA